MREPRGFGFFLSPPPQMRQLSAMGSTATLMLGLAQGQLGRSDRPSFSEGRVQNYPQLALLPALRSDDSELDGRSSAAEVQLVRRTATVDCGWTAGLGRENHHVVECLLPVYSRASNRRSRGSSPCPKRPDQPVKSLQGKRIATELVHITRWVSRGNGVDRVEFSWGARGQGAPIWSTRSWT